MERWPRDTESFLFVCFFLFLLENMLSPNIWDCPLNPTLNTWYKRLLSGWLRGIASVPYHPLRVCFGSNTVKLFFFYHFLWFFKKRLLVKFWVVCFLSNALLNFSFTYIDFVPYVHFKTKHKFYGYVNEHALIAWLIVLDICSKSCLFIF